MICFKHATICTPQEIIPDGMLIVEGGQIIGLGVFGDLPVPADAQVVEVDLNGFLLAPGLIDIQINGAFGSDFTESPGTLFDVASTLPQFGVTSFLPTVITSPESQVNAALEVWKQGPPVGFKGAVPLGYHLEGPMLNPGKKGAHNPAYIRPLSLQTVRGWSPDRGVLLVTLAPEMPGALEIIRILHRQGVIVSAGHSLASYDQALEGFRAGISCGTHLYNAMPTLDHRSPGLIAALLNQPDACVGLIVDGVHVHPAMVDLAWKLKGPEKLVLVTDAMAALGMPTGQYQLGDYVVAVDENSARLPDGTLAGSVLTLEAAVQNMMEVTHCTIAQAIACCTRNPADLLGMQHKGRLAVGADADLVVLTPQGQVMATVVMGKVVYSKLLQMEVGK